MGEKENDEFRQGIAVSRVSNKSTRPTTSRFARGISSFFGIDMARAMKGLFSELIFGNMAVSIPTYVRNDNSAAAYQVGTLNAVTNGKC